MRGPFTRCVVKTKASAFSRADLLFCLFALTLVFTMAISVFASNKSESQRVICFNNLRQVGHAFHMWANDYGDKIQWQVDLPLGGTRGHQIGGNAWWQFSWISNQLDSPKLLVCPADVGTTKVASEWGATPGGFLNPNYRNNAISYPLFLHAQPNAPASLLSGDRNFRVDTIGNSCVYVSAGTCFALFPRGMGAWTNAIHGLKGHLLLMDGSVPFTTSSEFQQAISSPLQDDNGSLHGLQVR